MKLRLPLVATLIGVVFSGCQARGLFFATETAGGLNVAGSATAPSTVSLDYHRAEIAVIPKSASGQTYAVYGGTDHEYSWGQSLALSQTFATGEAAVVATGGIPSQTAPKSQDGPVVFSTGTLFGLNLHAADSTSQTPGFIVGYRRAEAVWIPTKSESDETASVYADISIVAGAKDALIGRSPTLASGTRIQQRFATGAAATAIVAKPATKTKLDAAAGTSAGVAAATTALIDRSRYAHKLGAITDAAAQKQILERARGAFAGENVEMRSDYPDFVNVTVLNLAPAPLAKLQAATADLVK